MIVGETSVINNGSFINGYDEEATNFTGVVRPVAFVPVDQGGNIIPESNGVAIVENVKVIEGNKPYISDSPAPAPKGGVFIDVHALASGQPRSVLQQRVYVGQIDHSTGKPTAVFSTGVNDITKDASAKTVSVKIGTTQKIHPKPK